MGGTASAGAGARAGLARVAALGLLVALPGCGWIGDRFAGASRALGFGNADMPYRAAVRPDDDRRALAVTVTVPPGVPLADFRESARLPVTRYCIETFGSSEAEWTKDLASGDWAVSRSETTAGLRARCVSR